eukprot:10885725-Alexandrium_andersonii.AAC.1
MGECLVLGESQGQACRPASQHEQNRVEELVHTAARIALLPGSCRLREIIAGGALAPKAAW